MKCAPSTGCVYSFLDWRSGVAPRRRANPFPAERTARACTAPQLPKAPLCGFGNCGMVAPEGLEPSRPYEPQILSLVCLPVPARGLMLSSIHSNLVSQVEIPVPTLGAAHQQGAKCMLYLWNSGRTHEYGGRIFQPSAASCPGKAPQQTTFAARHTRCHDGPTLRDTDGRPPMRLLRRMHYCRCKIADTGTRLIWSTRPSDCHKSRASSVDWVLASPNTITNPT